MTNEQRISLQAHGLEELPTIKELEMIYMRNEGIDYQEDDGK